MGRVTPILIFNLVTSASVWISNKAWLSLLERLFSFLRFVDEFIIPFPPVNIILPSRVTLKQCRIILATCPTSVLLLTRRFRVSLSWKSRFWSISHTEVGDCSDGSWRLYSAHRTGLASIPSSSTDLSFPPGNICRIVGLSVLLLRKLGMYQYLLLLMLICWILYILYRIPLLPSVFFLWIGAVVN